MGNRCRNLLKCASKHENTVYKAVQISLHTVLIMLRLSSKEANPWLIGFYCVFFYLGVFLLHWQCAWDYRHVKKMKLFPIKCLRGCMVDQNLAVVFCVCNSIGFEIPNTTGSSESWQKLHQVLQMGVDTDCRTDFLCSDNDLNQKFQFLRNPLMGPVVTDFQPSSCVM